MIEISDYQDWMTNQIVDLYVEQYGIDPKICRYSIYEICTDPFVAGKSISVVALEGKSVVGMQTYRYWPYRYNGREFYSLQSGGTIVKSTYRGKGLFMEMLRRGNELLRKYGVDFVMGFPVPMSFGGFMKDGWLHLLSPRWLIRVMRPIRLVSQKWSEANLYVESSIPLGFELTLPNFSELSRCLSDKSIALSTSKEFLKYRYANDISNNNLHWSYRDNDICIVIICRLSRAHGFHELVIGDILWDKINMSGLRRAFGRFIEDVKRSSITAISTIIGGRNMALLSVLYVSGFLPIPKHIPFIIKNIGLSIHDWEIIKKASRWQIMTADCDVW